jgi:hypothetical protein
MNDGPHAHSGSLPQGSEGAPSWLWGRVSGFGRPGATDMRETRWLHATT